MTRQIPHTRHAVGRDVSAVEFHADDFGLFPAQSRRILDCHTGGALNGVSVIPNSPHLAECMALLAPFREEIAVTVHLNLIQGRCLSAPAQVPLLADEDGVFRCRFGGLLLRSFLPGRSRCAAQLKKELSAQIRAVRTFLPEDAPVRLDGHAHYHMLPVVFDALMEVIREEDLPVRYIRVPREHVGVYLRSRKKLHALSPINLVKVLVLNLLSARNQRRHRAILDRLEQRLFFGVLLSGHMDRQNVEAILPDALRLAQSQNRGIELLAHPGGVYEQQDMEELTNPDDMAFLTSSDRQGEYEMFLSIEE